MAKYRKKRKSGKCPEPLNTLIDLAGGLAMGAVASHMEKKYQYKAKGKINPYSVSAYGIASGRMKSTKDILRTGAMLGAMGSFDVEEDSRSRRHSYVLDDPIFDEIPEAKVNDNRYAWRMNCEDGSDCGVSPNDYETRSEYDAALHFAKTGQRRPSPRQSTQVKDKKNTSASAAGTYIFLRVSRLDNGINQYYLTKNQSLKVGDTVTVPTETGQSQGIVISINHSSAENAPQLPEETMWIV